MENNAVAEKKADQSRAGLAVSVSFASLITAAVIGAINFQLLPRAAFWISAIGFAVVAAMFFLPYAKALRDRWRASRIKGKADQLYRVQAIALCRGIGPLSEQSSVYSIGSIMNQLVTHKILAAGHAHAYLVALSTLRQSAEDLTSLEPNLKVAELMERIYRWLQLCVRLCEGLSSSINYHPIATEMPKGQWDALQRSWNESRQRAISLCSEFQAVSQGIRVIDPVTHVPEYISAVPEITR